MNLVTLICLCYIFVCNVLSVQVPAPPVSSSVATHTAVKFILDAARGKPRDQRIWISLANEFMVASQNQGKAVKYKVELHKQCEENRAYANFRSH